LFPQRLLNRLGAEGAEVAGQPELAADAHDQILDGGVGPPGPLRGAGAIEPIDPVEASAGRTGDPVADRAGAHPEAARDGANGLSLADGGDHLPMTLSDTVCLFMVLSSNGPFLEIL
jgi:hypothetical protein